MFRKNPKLTPIEHLPLGITFNNIKKSNLNLFEEIKKTLSLDTPSDSLQELYIDVKRSHSIHFYFNGQPVPSNCFPKEENENKKAFENFKKFLSTTLSERGKEILLNNYAQSKISTITGSILITGLSQNKLAPKAKNITSHIYFQFPADAKQMTVINQVKDYGYIQINELSEDKPKIEILPGTLAVELQIKDHSVSMVSMSSNSLQILSLILTNRFHENISFLNHCASMIKQCDEKMKEYTYDPLNVAYDHVKDQIIKTAFNYIKHPEAPTKIENYQTILQYLDDTSYKREYQTLQSFLLGLKEKIILFEGELDENTTSNLPMLEMLIKMKQDIQQLQKSFPFDFKNHFDIASLLQEQFQNTRETFNSLPTLRRSF